jgi:ubiquinone/menaquinone biosynthesis C-methylase UbiE
MTTTIDSMRHAATQAADGQQTPPNTLSCCSTFYEQDWVRNLAEDIFHPGGADLTRRTIAAMDLPAHAIVADLGCGTGTTALMLARDFSLQVTGLDLSASNIERAIERTDANSAAVRFIQADAQTLPFEESEFDGILAECSFSLFANQAAVLAEIKRVLKPGGRLAITDMAIGGPLPADIAEVLSPWTCLVDAMDQQAYAQRFAAAGFEVQVIADESSGLTNLIQLLKRKLLLLGASGVLAGNSMPTFDLATIKYWLGRFQAEVEKGSIRYLRFNLRNP